MSQSSTTLSALVPTTVPLLAYSIPLLIISIPLTFAGTFLTLDRSRSFPSSYTPVMTPGVSDGPKELSKLHFPLQGGVGGLLSGYVFGVHFSTFLSLLIPAISSSAPLSPNSFLAAWILSCILSTILGGRYRYCARLFPAVTGGSSLALAISVIIHPSLLPRQILTGLFAGISTFLILIISLLHLPHLTPILRHTLRIFTTSSGAFSLVLSTALLAYIATWANIWERLWLCDGDSWGTSKEKGLSSFYVILFISGVAADFGFNHWLGECPDEKWDNFLADYSAKIPNVSDRAGTFHPLPSFWGRLLGSTNKGDKKDDIFPLTFPNDTRDSIAKEPPGLFYDDDDYDKDFVNTLLSSHNLDSLAIPKKARSRNAKFKGKKGGRGFRDITSGRKQPVKFRQDLSSDSSDDSDGPQNVRPWLKQKVSLSSSPPTLVNQPTTTPLEDYTIELEYKSEQTRAKAENEPSIGPVYSDYEEDIGTPMIKTITDGDTEWRPGFMKRYTSSAGVSNADGAAASPISGRNFTPKGAVPATPSLIRAMDRISVAQREAFGPVSRSSTLMSTQSSSQSERKRSIPRIEGLPKVSETDLEDFYDYSDIEFRKGRLAPWEEFWKEVKYKATN